MILLSHDSNQTSRVGEIPGLTNGRFLSDTCPANVVSVTDMMMKEQLRGHHAISPVCRTVLARPTWVTFSIAPPHMRVSYHHACCLIDVLERSRTDDSNVAGYDWFCQQKSSYSFHISY